MLPILLMLKQNWKAVAVIALCAGVFFIAWDWRGDRADIEIAQLKADQAAAEQEAVNKALAAQAEKQAKANETGKELEKKLANLTAINKSLNRKLKNELQQNTVYSTCVVPPDGLRLLNEALSSRSGGRTPSQ